MRSRLTKAFLVALGLLAFMPVIAVDYVLDNYVRSKETARLQQSVDAIAGDSQFVVRGVVQSLRRILVDSPSLCTPTYLANVNRELQANAYLNQVLVEGRDGVQYCSAFDADVRYRVLSESVTIPGHAESITVVEMDGNPQPMLQVSQKFGANRTVSAFVLAAPILARELAPIVRDVRFLEIGLTNGTSILARGTEANGSTQGDLIAARAFAGEIPLKVDATMSFNQVRGNYADLDLGLTAVAGLIGIFTLMFALQVARKSKVPDFDLERAIVAGEMKPYYQPVMDLKSGSLIGCEVLVRWVKRNGQVVPPGAFIDYAEMSGLAVPMTLSLMEQVRFDLEDLCRDVRDFKVSINLFEGHFRDGTIVQDIESIFGDSAIEYRQLVFEITERRPFDDRVAATRVMSALHKLGVRIALDDAGTGHSNLSYLESLGIDIVKIDKIFIDMIKDAHTPVPVVDGLIAMAKDMDIEIIAEGVETQEQALYLRSKKVYFAQGYLFAAPMKLSTFMTLARALQPQRSESNLDPELAA